jgi:hypothetical protein
MIAGIRCNGSGSDTTFASVKQMINYANSKGLKGVCIWYAKCLYDTYSSEF